MAKAKARKSATKRAGKGPLGGATAATADRHILYQASVQAPDFEVEFADTLYRRINDRAPMLLREDFCGTGLVSCEWAKSHPQRRSIGLDIDREVLGWGRSHNVAALGDVAKRVQLLDCNVLTPPSTKVDVILALNYSYFTFKSRDVLLSYLSAARASLKRDGVMMLDAYGGSEALTTQEEEREIKNAGLKFTYIWEHASFNPIDNHAINYIHFRFKDGTEMRRAFKYDWRLWQLIEIREALLEVGFEAVDVFWEDADEKGNGSGTFRRRRTADSDPSWNAYMVART